MRVTDDTIIVSIAAGQPIERIENMFERSVKLVRVMPNTPAYGWCFHECHLLQR